MLLNALVASAGNEADPKLNIVAIPAETQPSPQAYSHSSSPKPESFPSDPHPHLSISEFPPSNVPGSGKAISHLHPRRKQQPTTRIRW